MKIIFNSYVNDWYWQIYDEISRNHEVILPENYKDKKNKNLMVDLFKLEKCVKENNKVDFIFDFRGFFDDLLEWNRKRISIPLVLFDTNVLNRPYKAKRSLFANMWYVEKRAKPLMEKYNRENLIYQGMAANPYIFKPLIVDKIYDVSFFGQHYGDRKYWLNLISKFCLRNNFTFYSPKGHGINRPWSFEDINKLYSQTKINLSFSPGGTVNLRTFEICMSGNFQLMQYTPYLEEYFKIDKEIVCWRDKKDLFKKILYFLENEDERDKLAKNGREKAHENHTWSKRFERIDNFLKEKKKKDISKFITNINSNLNEKDMNRIQKIQKENVDFNIKIVNFLLKRKGFKLKRDLKNLKPFKIVNHRQKITSYYSPNLKNFFILGIFKRILMVIKVIPYKSLINFEKWNELKRVFFLIENFDYSLPRFGVLTNGYECVIRDFKKEKWLKNIPHRKALKSRINLPIVFFIYLNKIIEKLIKKYKLSKINFLKVPIKKKLKFYRNSIKVS